jgi:hypothetical protein
MKPRVFVSSTVLDFEDLRSAIRYYLEEYGFDVQMSEYPDFDVDADASAVDACLKNLEQCQYFVLLMGYRRGDWYEKNKLSITHREYRAAKSLIENGHPLRIVAFVRRSIWLLKNDREALVRHFEHMSGELSKQVQSVGSSVIDDPEYIFAFLNEVAAGIKFPGSASPANNWIYSFEGFADIAQALRHGFKMSESLSQKRVERLLIEELKQNENRFYFPVYTEKSGTTDGIPHALGKNVLDYYRTNYFPRLCSPDGKVHIPSLGLTISGAEIGDLVTHSLIYPIAAGLNDIETRVLEKVLTEGLFLKYDVQKHDFDSTALSLSLENLRERILNFKNIFDTEIYKHFTDELTRIATDGSAFKASVQLSLQTCGVILALGRGARIPELISHVLKALEQRDYSGLIDFDFSDQDLYKYPGNSHSSVKT